MRMEGLALSFGIIRSIMLATGFTGRTAAIGVARCPWRSMPTPLTIPPQQIRLRQGECAGARVSGSITPGLSYPLVHGPQISTCSSIVLEMGAQDKPGGNAMARSG